MEHLNLITSHDRWFVMKETGELTYLPAQSTFGAMICLFATFDMFFA